MTTSLLGVELSSSVHKRLQGAIARPVAYLPFGHCAKASFGACAFTGQWLEPASGVYLAGNGYRGYLPHLARFIQPDRYSPFLKGGVNAYAYCSADPINRHDPSGKSALWLVVNLFSTVSLGSYGALMAARYRLAKPPRMVVAVDIALMAAGAAAQTVSWATREDSVQIANIAATTVTITGRLALAGYFFRKPRVPAGGNVAALSIGPIQS
jgi:RHS repeat-associated protein